MRTLLVTFVLIVGSVPLFQGDLSACGDKFLAIVGARSLRGNKAAYPASILLYRPPQIVKSLAIHDPELVAGLKHAGYKVEIIDDGSKLSASLNAQRYDIVLADIADAIAIEPQVRQAVAKPALVPVIYQRSKGEIAAAEKQFVCLLKAPEKVSRFVSVLDDLMKSRLEAARKAAPKPE